MKPKAKSREVRAFLCSSCRRIRKTRKQADRCCLCPCGEKVARGFTYHCAACRLRNDIRGAKKDVKRARIALAAREARVSRLEHGWAVQGTAPQGETK